MVAKIIYVASLDLISATIAFTQRFFQRKWLQIRLAWRKSNKRVSLSF